MSRVLFIIIFVAILCPGYVANGKQSGIVDITQEMKQRNETKTSLSPNGKYRAEAYGTITSITAGGLFPYEGICVLNVDNGDVIWKMEPGYYVVNFLWSPDSHYIGIYYEARIWGESIVFDIMNKKLISLPKLEDIALYYDNSVKPQRNRPDPYFEISEWLNAETVVVDFHWNKEDGEVFNGQYIFNLSTNTASYN